MSNGQFTLTSSYYGIIRAEFFNSILEAADSGFWSIEYNTAQPLCIEHKGQSIWGDKAKGGSYKKLCELAEANIGNDD